MPGRRIQRGYAINSRSFATCCAHHHLKQKVDHCLEIIESFGVTCCERHHDVRARYFMKLMQRYNIITRKFTKGEKVAKYLRRNARHSPNAERHMGKLHEYFTCVQLRTENLVRHANAYEQRMRHQPQRGIPLENRDIPIDWALYHQDS